MRYPPIARGTIVKTTGPNWSKRSEWTDEGWNQRQWQVIGEVVVHHDSHGLCYEVRHPDGTAACYDPTEIKVLGTSSEPDVADIQEVMEQLGQPG